MGRVPPRLVGAAAAALLVVLAHGAWTLLASDRSDVRAPRARPALMLFTSLPIYWPEADDVGARLRNPAEPHWARQALELRHTLLPLDVLAPPALGRSGRLLMIQPRPLAPAENVALDDWVRAGGRLLLIADPALTAPSVFPIGDRRRPQDGVLLSPILARWGLALEFEEDQPPGERRVALGQIRLPVNLPGRFALLDAQGRCRLLHRSLMASCRIGRGRVLAVADAALFEPATDGADRQQRAAALEALVSTVR